MTTAIRARAVAWQHAEAVVYPALVSMPETYVTELCVHVVEAGVTRAVAEHATAQIFDWMIPLIQLQGISDSIAFAYLEKHGQVRCGDIDAALQQDHHAIASVATGTSRTAAFGNQLELRRAASPAKMPVAVARTAQGCFEPSCLQPVFLHA
jgi:hypothetical protein